jgi:hypothetical protein
MRLIWSGTRRPTPEPLNEYVNAPTVERGVEFDVPDKEANDLLAAFKPNLREVS